MKKITAICLVLCLLVMAFAGCSSEKEETKAGGTLNLYTWAEMFDPAVLESFEKETGITVNYTNFDFDETMLARLEAANGGDYDLIIADDYIIETVIAEGLAQKLDKSQIKNYANINPIYQGQFYDPTDEYTVPYGAGVQTIVYNPAKIKVDVKGYGDLWNEAFKDDLAVIANYRVIVGMAEKVLGYSYNTNDLSEIEAAGEKLCELAPNIRLIKDDNVQDDLVTGEVNAAVMYTSQVTMAMLAKPDLKVVYPEEGIGFGIMGMFVPSKAPNAAAAHAFIDYILRPEISKQSFEYLGYYCTTKAADDLIDPEYRDFLVLPSSFKSEDMEMIGNISAEASAKQDEIWTRFKDLCE